MKHCKTSVALDPKSLARQIFSNTLQQIDVRSAVSRNIRVDDSRVSIAASLFELKSIKKAIIIAVGKAATPMYEATLEALHAAPGLIEKLEAIVIAPQAPASSQRRLQFFAGGHPTPTETSRRAADAVLSLLSTADADTLVIFLVSGGSSSMMELPIDPTVSVEDVANFNRVLVGSGLPILQINSLRKHLSAVKGGRLAAASAPAMQCTLIISDVPGDSLDVVGSGPSLPDRSSSAERLEIYQHLRTSHRMPVSIERFFESTDQAETPKPNDAIFDRAAWASLLSSEHLATAAASNAAVAGFHVEIDNTCDDWPSDEAADYLLDRCLHLKRANPKSCLISVGEVTVSLPGSAGRGGRNQHFALQCALKLAERGDNITVLSAGSDGIDGNSSAAGAVADADTCRRAALLGLNASSYLADFNSFAFFDALEDTIITGPTGNNLRDLRILLT